ncbi:possible thioesterase [Rhodococcus jostii RHA1]|jgi:acyl-coenzyme A thioesterase PaaI-like protein|uniref:Possible thioesterase n=1 Tax=Rhodococcus jostii (strain RHA1) TaxID=101510 RepID=Q0SJY1_RHOJR|nr:PaaI family thioesterase [Rhodococcus jostii]ABG92155.1 possible thioesterase [Rhodococcus jostii RHA1]
MEVEVEVGVSEVEWDEVHDGGFIGLIGPLLLRRGDGGAREYGLRCEPKHRNLRGVVQGGLIMAFADRALGSTALAETGTQNMATVQLNVSFLGIVRVGDLLTSSPRIVRRTASIVFADSDLRVNDSVVATATGVFKILADSSPPVGVGAAAEIRLR